MRSQFGWPGAVVRALGVLVALLVLLVVVPNLLLTRLTGLERSGRVAVATAWFTVALVGIAWGLRRLQSRHLI